MSATGEQIAKGRPWEAWMHDIRCAMGAASFDEARSFFSLARMNGAPEAEIVEWQRLFLFWQTVAS